MNRRTHTALKLAGIALALSSLGGALTGCSGSDSDGGSASDAASSAESDAPDEVTKDGFCETVTGLSAAVGQAGNEPRDAIKALKDWASGMEDYGSPSELSDEVQGGLEILIATFNDIDEDASLEDLQTLGAESSDADKKKAEEFNAWTSKNCPPPAAPSDDAS